MGWPTIGAAALYLIQAGMALREGMPAYTLVYFAYALANIGLVWAMVKGL